MCGFLHVVATITPIGERQLRRERPGSPGFDIDAVTDTDLVEPASPPAPVTMDDLERVICDTAFRPPGIAVRGLGPREYAFQQPGLAREVRISTDAAYYEQNADNVELWSPGNPTFPPLTIRPDAVQVERLVDLFKLKSKTVPTPC